MAENMVEITAHLVNGCSIDVEIEPAELARLENLLARQRQGAVLVTSDTVDTSFHGGRHWLSAGEVSTYHRRESTV